MRSVPAILLSLMPQGSISIYATKTLWSLAADELEWAGVIRLQCRGL